MVLKDKVAIVTGVAQGLGRAYVRRLLTEGARFGRAGFELVTLVIW